MALSTDIRLPKNVVPVFPRRCIYSGEWDPETEVVVVANSQSAILSFLAPILLLFGWRRFRAPILRKHRGRFYLETLGRDIIMIAIVVVAVFMLTPMLGNKASFRKLKLLGLVLVVASPWILFEVFFPRRFNVTARGEWIDYEFGSPEYAAEFAELNAPNVIQIS